MDVAEVMAHGDLQVAHEKELRELYQVGHELVHDLMSVALGKADDALTSRLESMNQFRRQIEQERGTFLTRELFDAWVKGNDLRREELLGAQRIRDEKAGDAISDVRGQLRGYAIAAGLIFSFISLVLKFVPSGFGITH